jgi:predicted nuclease with TOPRIM domain
MDICGMEDLTSYRERRRTVKNRIIELVSDKEAVTGEICAKAAELEGLNDNIKKIVDGMENPVVTDHAVVRYFERVMGINIQDIKDEVVKAESHTCIYKGNTIVTVLV